MQKSELNKQEMAVAKKTRTAKEMKVFYPLFSPRCFCNCCWSSTVRLPAGAGSIAAPIIWRRWRHQSRRRA
jgi:hypothetical protein